MEYSLWLKSEQEKSDSSSWEEVGGVLQPFIRDCDRRLHGDRAVGHAASGKDSPQLAATHGEYWATIPNTNEAATCLTS